ncbi:MAG: fused response regulator/phosphatase [Nitrosomonadales bacterium]|nr:fused response regulator/phosphatase [Nitrosomonadales bacterium]
MMEDQGLRILVVDDTRSNRVVLQAMLSKMGHQSILAESGEEALALFRESQPDLALVDVMMPGMDGYQTVQAMRRLADTWVPVIFVSAMGQNEDIVRGIQAGADDYLTKPVNYGILQAKIDALHERIKMSRQLAKQNRLLLDYHDKTREEGAIALDFMRRLAALDKINDPLVNFHLQPAEDFSGDLIAVARTPAGQLHVLLADSTGHGLTAALAVMPVLQPFHTMSSKGFSLAAIAAEINRKVKEYLPQNRFVAASILALDIEDRMIGVWNGGCPPVVVLDQQGEIAWQFKSSHVPMGIFRPDDFDDKIEWYYYGDTPCQVLMSSDGAVDCADHRSLEAGMGLMLDSMKSGASAGRLGQLVNMLQTKLGDGSALDDIALILVDCPLDEFDSRDQQSSRQIPQQGQMVAALTDSSWQFSLKLTAAQLKRLDAVPLLLNLINQIEPDNSDVAGKLFLIMSELFNNALDHGVLKLDSSLKHDPEGMERYFDERAARLKQLEVGEIEIGLARAEYAGRPCIRVRVKDSGQGFDVSVLHLDIEVSTRRHGRGVALVRSLVSELHFNSNGTEVEASLVL